jgi:DNA repair protein NreA
MMDCIRCKGRGFCGRQACPHILKASAMFNVRQAIKKSSFSGSSPAPFIGRFGYPHVNVGILSPPGETDAWKYDAPKHWSANGYAIPDIVSLRSSLVNSREKTDIRGRSVEVAREVGLSSSPVEVEIELEDRPRFSLSADSVLAPMGPVGRLKKAVITSNPKIDRKVDKVYGDSDLRASQAIQYLHKNGFDENFLSKLLSVGAIGMKPERRLVPTRWSITATDDMVGKKEIDEIRSFPTADDYSAYFGSYLGNYYLVLLIPEIWGYELFETYMPNASWNTSEETSYSTDHEGYRGRKGYAENCAGGYYTARLAVAEKEKELGKQARAIVIRIITGEYSIPLGVWVTREATRRSLAGKPILFDTLDLMLSYAKSLCRKKFSLDIGMMLKKSRLLTESREQTRLSAF